MRPGLHLIWSAVRHEVFLRSLYGAFNSRNIGAVLAAMTSDVDWSRYAGDPSVEPVNRMQHSDGKVEVAVHQIVRNRSGSVLSDEEVRHTDTFRGDLIERMTIGDDGGADETVGSGRASPSRKPNPLRHTERTIRRWPPPLSVGDRLTGRRFAERPHSVSVAVWLAS